MGFVDADHLKPGDELQSTAPMTVKITSVHLFHTTTVTYDLTINDLHTYYVVDDHTPVLVHTLDGPHPQRHGTASSEAPESARPECAAAAQGAPASACWTGSDTSCLFRNKSRLDQLTYWILAVGGSGYVAGDSTPYCSAHDRIAAGQGCGAGLRQVVGMVSVCHMRTA
jgi:hypothetical protein